MAPKIDMKKLPPYVKVILSLIPLIIFVVLFITLIYKPKNKEIVSLQQIVVKLDNEISTGEVKIRKLDQLRAENALLKAKLAKLQEQLPEEQEVTALLRQISDLGIKSGLEILLWKPGSRRIAPSGLYAEIPVQIEVITGYHNLGDFYSYISRLKRIVNISGINITAKGKGKGDDRSLNSAKFTAVTFGALKAGEGTKKGKKRKKGKRK